MTATTQGTSRPAAWLVLLAVGAAVAVVSAVLPMGGPAPRALLPGAQLVAVVLVVWRFRTTTPRPALPWVVFLLGVAVSLVADTTGAILGDAARWATDRPLLDALYVLSYLLLFGGIVLAARSRGAGRDVGEIVDALIVTAAAGTAAFALVLGVNLEEAPGDAARLASIAVVLIGVGMIGASTLVFVRVGRLTAAMGLLVGALAANVVADTLYANGVLGQTVLPRGAADAFAILTSTLFAAAMLHPSIGDLLRVEPGAAPLGPRTRLGFISVAAVFAAVVGLTGQLTGEDVFVDFVTDALVLAIVALFALRAWILATEAGRAEARLARTTTDLERSAALVAGISEAMPGALFAGDLATQTLDYVSPGLAAMLGADAASALGKPGWIVERLHPDDRAEFIARSQQARAAGMRSLSLENRMRTEDGGYRTVASTIRYLAGRRGKVDRFVGVGIDVTDRAAAEAERDAAQRFAEEVVLLSPGVLFRGRFAPAVLDFVSPGVEPLLGYRPDEMLGVDGWFMAHLHPDDMTGHIEAFDEAITGGGEVTRVIRLAAADGAYRSLLTTVRVSVDPDGTARYFASAIDVTEQEAVQARLRERERFIADVARTSAGVIFAGRADTDTIDFVSPGVERVLGYTPEEIIGVPGFLQGILHPDDTALRIAQRDDAVADPAGGSGAVRRIRGKDGRYRSLVIATRVVLDPEGVARFVSNAMDISDRIEVERDLVAARDFVEQLVATSPGMIFRGRLDPAAIDFMSPGVEQLLGYRPDEVVGAEDWVATHIHPDDGPGQAEMLRTLVASGGGEGTRMVRIRTLAGGYRAFLATMRLRIGADGRPEYVASAIDVTEHEEAAARLRERDTFIADVMQTSPAVIFAGRADTDTVDYVSSSVEQVLGYAPAEVLGIPGFVWEHVHPDDAAAWTAERSSAVVTGTLDAGAVRRILAKDGTYRSLVFATHASRDANGVQRFVSSAIDISDRIDLEESLVAARDSAEAASRAKTEFLSLVSHELRTPLTAILGFGELLERTDLPDQARKDVATILAAGRRELRLVNRILDFVKLESGRLQLATGLVLPAEIVRQAITRARVAAPAGVVIEDRTREYADLACAGDARRLGPIVDDLLDNAIHHGGAAVTVTAMVEPAADGRVRIVVTDDGVGMTAEQIADAMAPLNTNGIGTGVALGLSLARRLVQAMGGDLEIVSRPGAGTSVAVTMAAFEPAPSVGSPGTPGTYGAPTIRSLPTRDGVETSPVGFVRPREGGTG